MNYDWGGAQCVWSSAGESPARSVGARVDSDYCGNIIRNKFYVSFAKEPYKRDDILQKKPIIVRVDSDYCGHIIRNKEGPWTTTGVVLGMNWEAEIERNVRGFCSDPPFDKNFRSFVAIFLHLTRNFALFAENLYFIWQGDLSQRRVFSECSGNLFREHWGTGAVRGGGLGLRPKKMYGERLGDGVEYHLMKPTPRR